MNNTFSLNGKTLLVTGASSGIGRSICIACSNMGARVILTARNKIKLEETMSLMDGDMHSVFVADLTNISDRIYLVEQLPHLDGVVHCMGVMNRIPCKSISKEDIDSVFVPNTEAPILLQSELLQSRKLLKGSSVVFIASIAAFSAVPCNALYSASKAALISYSKVLSLEVASKRIRVNCICPAMVWTELARVGTTLEQLKADELNYPLGRYGQPDDIANLAVYLLSDASSWMTGSCINITGGAF